MASQNPCVELVDTTWLEDYLDVAINALREAVEIHDVVVVVVMCEGTSGLEPT